MALTVGPPGTSPGISTSGAKPSPSDKTGWLGEAWRRGAAGAWHGSYSAHPSKGKNNHKRIEQCAPKK
eukprot:608990-Amphidinium_carterae.1